MEGNLATDEGSNCVFPKLSRRESLLIKFLQSIYFGTLKIRRSEIGSTVAREHANVEGASVLVQDPKAMAGWGIIERYSDELYCK